MEEVNKTGDESQLKTTVEATCLDAAKEERPRASPDLPKVPNVPSILK